MAFTVETVEVLTLATASVTNNVNTFVGNGFGAVIGHTAQETISDGGGATDVVPEFQILGTAAADMTAMIGGWSTTATRAAAPVLALAKSGHASIGSHTVVTDGEILGSIIAYGDDGTDIESPAAAIEFAVDGTPGTGDMPGEIKFYTTADEGETLTLGLTLSAAQAATFAGAVTVASLACTAAGTFGGGYGSTGATISTAGVIQANGAITSDGAVTGATLAGTVSTAAQNSITSASSLATVGTVTSGTWSTGAVIGGATVTVGSDATGDVYYRNAGGVFTRLAAGSDADVLTLASGIPSWATPTVGDITGVTAGNGLSGGGASGTVSLALDLSELADTAIADGDYIVFTDATDSAASVKGDLADVATLFAGTGLTASSSVIGIDAAQTVITSLLAVDIKIGEDDETKVDFETANEIHFYAANTEQVYLADNIFGPQSDSDVDLGTTGVRWKDLYVDSITCTDQITATGFTGTLDGILGSGAAAAATVTTLAAGGDVTVANGYGMVIGNASQISSAVGNAELQVLGTGNADAAIDIGRFSANGQNGTLSFIKGRGGIGDATALNSGDYIGVIQFYGADGTDLATSGANISVVASGTIAENRIPTYMTFSTGTDAAPTVVTEAMRIDSSQNVTLVGGSTLQMGVDGDSGDNLIYLRGGSSGDAGKIALNHYGHGDHHIEIGQAANGVLALCATSGGDALTVGTSGLIGINETANGNMTIGLTIDQDANGDQIFALKMSGVTQPATGVAETDTYYDIGVVATNSGGARLRGFKDGDGGASKAIEIQGILGENVTGTKSTSGLGICNFDNYVSDGSTSITTPNVNGNLVSMQSGGSTKFIFDADGDSHQDVGTAWTNMDNEPDALITRSVGIVMDPKTIIKSKFDDWNRDHKEDLIRTGLISRLSPEEEAQGDRPLMNTTQLARLHNGAIWQTHTEVQQMKEDFVEALDQRDTKIALLEQRLNRLEN